MAARLDTVMPLADHRAGKGRWLRQTEPGLHSYSWTAYRKLFCFCAAGGYSAWTSENRKKCKYLSKNEGLASEQAARAVVPGFDDLTEKDKNKKRKEVEEAYKFSAVSVILASASVK
ncbi:unnamed protein product [Amoebophrya sp. A25]|nr:unnamed protein product [Amoebophrya sp. A25]|eukprot:GSA25T00009320001.1